MKWQPEPVTPKSFEIVHSPSSGLGGGAPGRTRDAGHSHSDAPGRAAGPAIWSRLKHFLNPFDGRYEALKAGPWHLIVLRDFTAGPDRRHGGHPPGHGLRHRHRV